MPAPLRVYVGHDPRDELAYRACVASLTARASIPLDVRRLTDHALRRAGVYWRPYHVETNGQMIDLVDGRPFSTLFAFARFAIPLVDRSAEWVLFCDADFFWRADVAELLAGADRSKDLSVVQHDHRPTESLKMDGVRQSLYWRKNWSSLMLMRPARLPGLTAYALNNWPGRSLHGLLWAADAQIGALPAAWNWLEGWSDPAAAPAAVHYTRGTPDMLGDGLPFAAEWWSAVAAWRPEMEDVAWTPDSSTNASQSVA